jgi:hypothetical protein
LHDLAKFQQFFLPLDGGGEVGVEKRSMKRHDSTHSPNPSHQRLRRNAPNLSFRTSRLRVGEIRNPGETHDINTFWISRHHFGGGG